MFRLIELIWAVFGSVYLVAFEKGVALRCVARMEWDQQAALCFVFFVIFFASYFEEREIRSGDAVVTSSCVGVLYVLRITITR